MEKNSDFDFSIVTENYYVESKTAKKKANLEEEKGKIKTRKKKSKKRDLENIIIPRDKEIIFDNDKLNGLFLELKNLSIDKKIFFRYFIKDLP